MGKSFDDVKPQTNERWEDKLVWEEMPQAGELYKYRVMGDLFVFGRHWINTKPHDRDNGKSFPRECTNFNSETEEADLDRGCPSCERGIYISKHFLVNVINREWQEQGRRNPVSTQGPMPPGVVGDIIKLKKLNGGHHVNSKDNGRDIWMSYDQNAAGAKKWGVQIDPNPRAPLKPTELEYPLNKFEEFYPNFNPDSKDGAAFLAAYNADTHKSLTRLKYYEDAEAADAPAPATTAADAPPPKAMTGVNTETEAVQAPAQSLPSTAQPAPAPAASQPQAELANTPSAAQEATSSSTGEQCPHPDVSFGDFQGDNTCMKCPSKQSCIAAG